MSTERTPGADADPLDLLEGVFEHMPAALQVRAADGRPVRANRRFRELFGSSPPVECDPVLDDHARSDLEELARRSLGGETIRVEPRWYAPRALRPANTSKPRRVWAELKVFPLLDRNGNAHVALCFHDMTEQRERLDALEAQARHREARAAILDAALDCVITMDASGRITYFNDAAEETFGYARTEAIGRTVADLLMPPRLRTAHQTGLAKYLATGEGPVIKRRIELTATRADGTEFPVELIIVPARSEGLISFTGFVRDLTERKEVERALVRSEARFRRLLDAGILGIITADIRGNILEANEAFLRMVGYTQEEVRSGRVRWSDMTPPEWQPLDDRAVDQLTETGVAAPWEKEYVRRDGTRVPVLVGVAMLDAQKGECVAFILDLTDQKEAEGALERMREEREASLRESIQARDDFLAVAGHELRTPLAALLLQLQSIQRTRPNLPPKVANRLDKVAAAGLRLRRLVEQLLDVSRLTAGALHLEPGRVDLSDVVREVVARTRDVSAHLVPVVVRGEKHVIGWWDRERIEQAIENLVGNAVKYGEGKPVEIDLQIEDDEVVLGVIDHGVGIDEDHQKRIFERFERAVASRDFGGLGLGLWIARRVIEASGGRIAVRSSPGQGAAFTVRLPLQSSGSKENHAAL